jgi:ATP/maltotriose-dependent transcriptional regulator MalT
MQRPPPTTGAASTPAADGGARLSAREREMLGHLAAGRSIGQIAAAMSISTNTVRGHSRSLLAKLGADERQQAVQRARELDIL